jgi:hypothetical protein
MAGFASRIGRKVIIRLADRNRPVVTVRTARRDASMIHPSARKAYRTPVASLTNCSGRKVIVRLAGRCRAVVAGGAA